MEPVWDYFEFLWTVLRTDTAQTIWLIWLTLVLILDGVVEKMNKGGTARWVKAKGKNVPDA